MNLRMTYGNYQALRFALYALVILLFNAALSYFPARVDLTAQQVYSLAPASKDTVAQLEEPVTIRVYLSSNLPSHYNILSSLLRDLLQSYRSSARSGMFSYSVNLIRSDDSSEKTRKLEEEANQYGIYPVQLQGSDGNEFKAVSAYIGLAISQGENLEVLTPLEPGDNMQYKITAALQKMSRKGSALLSMNENLKIYYYFSPRLAELENGQYARFPENFQQVMAATNEQLYGRADSQVIDPDNLPPGLPQPGELDLPDTEINLAGGGTQKVYSAIVIDNEGRYKAFSLLQLQPTLELGPTGLVQGSSVNVIDPRQLEGQLADLAIGSLGIAQNIGYISDRDTASFEVPNPQRPDQGANLNQFSQEARDLYDFQPVKLDEGIGKDVNILMLVDPMRQLSDWDLYQIDQFVMRGGRLIVAMQPYQIMQSPYAMGAQSIPNPNIEGVQSSEGEKKQLHTLADLLQHYGIEYQQSMVFDINSYVNRGQNPQTGGYQETRIYYIPEINAEESSEMSFIKGLKKIFFYNSAPLKAVGDSIVLAKSSPKAWTEDLSDGTKDPSRVVPPPPEQQGEQNLLMASGGPLESFFKGKEIPEQPQKEQQDEPQQEEENGSLASVQGAFIERSEHGKVLVSGTSLIFDRQLLSVPTNKALALNLLDYMAGNIEMANLRARNDVPTFIDGATGNVHKNIIKWYNILGLPLKVGILGLLLLLNWRRRQLKLQALFTQGSKESSV